MRMHRVLLGVGVVVVAAAVSASSEAPAAGVTISAQPWAQLSSFTTPAALPTTATVALSEADQFGARQRQPQSQGQELRSAVVRVNAAQHWTPTNIIVRRGDRLAFAVTGEITPVAGGGRVGPIGGTGKAPHFPVADANIGALIGRVGDGRPFAVTGVGEVEMPADGQLFLGINDDNVSDNLGTFVVRVGPAGMIGTTGQARSGEPTTLPFGQTNTFTVDAKQPWTATGISVRQGERVTFTVSGNVSWTNAPNDVTSGDGGPMDAARQRNYPVSAVGVAGLIGRVNNQPFAIGQAAGQSVFMPASGELYLGINDDYFDDNRGFYTVTVRANGGANPRR